tara:strand:- start:3409 stop:5196 length:1788 start_codon:yes stop_codon:yes gene_type:complete
MISLDKLRKRSGLLIAAVGIALGAFLLGDLMNSGASLFTSAQGVIGEINDAVIDYRDFETEAQNLDRIFNGSQDRNGLRDNLWNDKVNEIIMGEQYQELGIAISSEELASLSFGYKSGNMSPTAKQFFGITGQEVSSPQLASLIQQIHDNDPLRWMYFENVLRKERQGQKYNSLVRQGLMASNTDAETFFNEQGTQVSGSYLFKAFDNKIEVSDAEVISYYKSHKEDYPQNGSRELSLAIFEITPTMNDRKAIEKRVESFIEDKVVFNKNTKTNEVEVGFRNTPDPAAFVEANSDQSFDATFYAEGQLSPAIETQMRKAELGFVFGPYEEDNSYKIARLNARNNDSIQVAVLSLTIDASEETSNEIYAQASEMASSKNKDELEVMAEQKNVALTTVNVQEGDRTFAGIEEARSLVFWAYNENTKVNSVKLYDQNNRICVLMLSDIIEEGTQELEDVRMQVESALRKEKSSQAIVAEFSQALTSATDINSLGKQMNIASEQATTLSFSSNTIPGGFEPNVVGAFYGVEKGQLSAPIIGNSGVYVVSPSDFKDSQVPKEYSSLKKQLEAQLQPRANFEVFNALKAMSDVEDNRVKFY